LACSANELSATTVTGNARAVSHAGRRDEILETFTRHVAEHGYDRTNFSDIAAELGMSKGTIVHHFGTKDKLLAELHERYMRRRLDEAITIVNRLKTPAEQMAGLIAAYVLYQTHDRHSTIAFQREVVRSASEAMTQARRLRDEYRDLAVGVLQRGITDGSFRDGNARLRALQIFGSTQWMWTWYDPAGRDTPDQVAASYIDLALGGLLLRRAVLDELKHVEGEVMRTVRDCLGAPGVSGWRQVG
jgi:AcrR family transcriptional regulator